MRFLAFLHLPCVFMATARSRPPRRNAPPRSRAKSVTIFYDDAEPTYSSFRERYFTRSSTCPGAVVITYLMPDLTAEERQVFCANYDPETRSHSMPAQGSRDAFGRCETPSKTCKLVNTTRKKRCLLWGSVNRPKKAR
jgi:hypothetical protein